MPYHPILHPARLKFKIGSKVRCTLLPDERSVIRRVTGIVYDGEGINYPSRLALTADDGRECPYCKRNGTAIESFLDAAYFELVYDRSNRRKVRELGLLPRPYQGERYE